uniref:Uncharacterized protein n=1 Tax=Tanacetum cinerariifolium TaxID=118510 RepID=A0A699L4K3_TANCI|nr:hypothetical protein [Tanacetum cinerariifolium]
MWSQAPVSYDKYALWGISYWGRKRQQFIDLRSTESLLKMSTQNVESSLSPNFKLSNGTTISTWIGSLCVEMMTSYTSSKKNKDKQNRLMRIDELHKFSDDTLNDVRTALDDRLKDTLTPDLLAGPTYELMRGSCSSLTELEYHLEEVYKATTDQLDWVNPEGLQYPHNLLQPLPLIPDNRGRRVIPFEHFINNDLEYLRGGASSRKYTTSVTKTKAADYGHIKWIEDLVPRKMWIQQPIDYNKHALWEVSHWGLKRKQFYGYAINQESA